MHSVTRRQYNDHFIQIVLSALLVLVLSACGGGGSGSPGSPNNTPSSSSSSSAPAVELTANAGEDVVVNAGDIVELKPGGTGNITGRTWTRLAGPSVTLTAVEFDQAHFTFVAPSTGTEPHITIEYRLTVRDASGSTASDTISIRINRVNQAPAADAGADLTVIGLSEVELSGSGVDADGEVVSYSWQQTGAGDQVVLVDADKAVTRFEAPSTDEILTLEFTLTVTDNDGATATDTVTVTVTSENAPVVDLIFPPAQGGYTETTISAFGHVEVRAGATLEILRVNAGGESVTAIVDAAGNWRAENVPVFPEQNAFTLRVEAEDSVGRLGYAVSVLRSSHTGAGSGVSWKTMTALELDMQEQVAYVLTSGNAASDVQLIPVDLKTGERKPSITYFGSSAQGTTQTAFSAMLYDEAAGRFYITSNPAAQELPKQVVRVDRETGMRAVLSGTGPDLVNPVGLAFGPDDQLLVVNHGAHAILTVDPATGDRSVLADESIAGVGVEYPLEVVWDASVNRLLVSLNFLHNTPVLNVDLTSDPVMGSIFTSNNGNSGPNLRDGSGGMVLDEAGGRLFLRNTSDRNIIAIDLVSGTRSLVAENLWGSLANTNIRGDIAYDPVHKLLYSTAASSPPSNHGLFVIDPESGNKVLLSRPGN